MHFPTHSLLRASLFPSKLLGLPHYSCSLENRQLILNVRRLLDIRFGTFIGTKCSFLREEAVTQLL